MHVTETSVILGLGIGWEGGSYLPGPDTYPWLSVRFPGVTTLTHFCWQFWAGKLRMEISERRDSSILAIIAQVSSDP